MPTHERVTLRAMRKGFLVAAALIAIAVTINAQQPAGRPVKVTLHEGTSMAAAMSPDGRTIAIDLLGTLWTMPAAWRGSDADHRHLDGCTAAVVVAGWHPPRVPGVSQQHLADLDGQSRWQRPEGRDVRTVRRSRAVVVA